MSELSEKDMEIIIEVIRHFVEVDQAILFGSRAKGTQRHGSDVDIAIQGYGSDSVAAEISGILNDETPLPYTFDVVALDAIENQALKEHIQRVGITFYSKRI